MKVILQKRKMGYNKSAQLHGAQKQHFMAAGYGILG